MDPAKMKVVDLRSELGALGLDTKGNKPALVERLKKALEAKSGKALPDTSILDTSTEDVDEPATPRRPGPAARTTRRSSSSRLAAATPAKDTSEEADDTGTTRPAARATRRRSSSRLAGTPVKQARKGSREPIEEEPKTEAVSEPIPPPEPSEPSSPPEPSPPSLAPVAQPGSEPTPQPVAAPKPVPAPPAQPEPVAEPAPSKEQPAASDIYSIEDDKSQSPVPIKEEEPMDVQEAESEQKKDEVVQEKMNVDQDQEIKAEKDGDENEDAESKEEREQQLARQVSEEEEWRQLNERLALRDQERRAREKQQAEDDARRLRELSDDPVRLQRLKRKQEKKARWSNFYKSVEVTNEILTPPVESEILKGKKESADARVAEPELNDERITLSWYDSDLNQYLELPELSQVVPLSEGAFAHAWAGARASHGVAKGRVYYEVRVGDVNPSTETTEKENISSGLRVGWSTEDSSLHLGADALSWAYESSGRRVRGGEFADYGAPLKERDVVGACLDLESTPCKISYTVNGVEQGIAYEFDKSELGDKALFPHILTKNMCYRVNFGYDKRGSLPQSRSVTPRPSETRGPKEGPLAPRAAAAPPEREPRADPALLSPPIDDSPMPPPPAATSTPRRSLRRKTVLEKSIHFTSIERAAACGIDEEEVRDDPSQLENVRTWMNELSLPETSSIPPFCNVPPETGCDESDNTLRESRPASSGDYDSSDDVTAPVGPVPSTSSTAGSRRQDTPGRPAEGSEFDSDFDDEFDVEELVDGGGMTRNILDDSELDESVLREVRSIERAMDEAIENFVGVSTDFHWQADFDTFGGVPETFSGPSPGAVKDYDTPYEAFTDIWSRDIIEHIVTETNRYAKQVIGTETAAGALGTSSRLHRWVHTDVDEIYLYFAILIFMGIDPRSSQHEYWKTNSFLEMPKFRQLMTYNRFILLSKFLHFSDNSNASQDLPLSGGNKLSAKLRKLSPVIVHLNSKFASLYNLDQDFAIDESLTLYKGRLSWAQAIKTKAARLGIKSFELCESKMGYLYKFDIYTGKNTERDDDVVAPSADLASKSTQVVLDLLKGLERRGHCVTMDNYYNCPALARYLKSMGFDCLGTLRVNRRHVPEDIAKVPKNVPRGTIVARHSGDVSCIAWKDSRAVVTIISTYHTDETYVRRKFGRKVVKPVAVRDYNNTMGGVDLKDQKLSMYLMERKRCLKWYMKIFKRLLNVSVHNALILLLSSLGRRTLPLITHRNFREKLAESLVEAHRPSPRPIVIPVDEAMRLRRDLVHRPEYLDARRRMRCHICLRKGVRKLVHLKCVTCDEGLCFGDCWADWHSLEQLPGKTIHVRKERRRE